MRRMKNSQEHAMAQTVVTAAPGQLVAIQADGCGVGSDLRDSAIRSKYRAVRPEERLRLAENVESHFPNLNIV